MGDRREARCPYCATPLEPGVDRCPSCGVDPEKAEGVDLHVRPSDPGGSSGLELDDAPRVRRKRPSLPPSAAEVAASGGDAVAGREGFRAYASATTPREGFLRGGFRAVVTIAGVLLATAV